MYTVVDIDDNYVTLRNPWGATIRPQAAKRVALSELLEKTTRGILPTLALVKLLKIPLFRN